MKIRTIHLSVLLLFLMGTSCTQSRNQQKHQQEVLRNGSVLFVRYGCNICHSLDSKVIYGPPLNDFYMKEVDVVRQGEVKKLTADRNYIKRAIAWPRYERVLEYQNKDMPITNFPDKDINTLVEYLIILNKANQSNK